MDTKVINGGLVVLELENKKSPTLHDEYSLDLYKIPSGEKIHLFTTKNLCKTVSPATTDRFSLNPKYQAELEEMIK